MGKVQKLSAAGESGSGAEQRDIWVWMHFVKKGIENRISHDFGISASFLILGSQGSDCTWNVSPASVFENQKTFLESQDAR